MSGAYADMKELLAGNEPLARCYFADNDLIAAGAMKAFREAGLRIPQDVAVIGFDNTSLCEMLDPPLTTVNVPKQALGRTAVLRLQELMSAQTGAVRESTKTALSTSLVRRASV